jgi:flagellar motility protein MotE (MotC chaperone)
MDDDSDTKLKSIRVKKTTLAVLEELAAAEDRSWSYYVNRLLDQHAAANARVVQLRRRK